MDKASADKKVFALCADLCKTLTNSKRIEILEILRAGERSATELVDMLDINKANLSQHMSLLRQRRLVNTRREGQSIFYSIGNQNFLKGFDIIRGVLYEQMNEDSKILEHSRTQVKVSKPKQRKVA